MRQLLRNLGEYSNYWHCELLNYYTPSPPPLWWLFSRCVWVSFSFFHSLFYEGTFATVWPQSSAPLIPSLPPPSTLSFSIFYFFPFLLALFSCFSIPSHSTRIVPLHFQARCCRRWLNLALVFCVWILCYVHFLVKDACLFLSYLI